MYYFSMKNTLTYHHGSTLEGGAAEPEKKIKSQNAKGKSERSADLRCCDPRFFSPKIEDLNEEPQTSKAGVCIATP
jgi:hypothetical protein